MRFLPCFELMPVLPPTEELTWASSVVGIWMKPHAAAENCRGKAGEIADDTAAKGDDTVAALDRCGQQAVTDFGELAEALRRLAGWENDGGAFDSSRAQGVLERLQMAACDILVGDDRGERPRQERSDMRADFGKEAVADGDVIAAVAKRDMHLGDRRRMFHCFHSGDPIRSSRRAP